MRITDTSVIAGNGQEAIELLSGPIRLLDMVEVKSNSFIVLRTPPLSDSNMESIHQAFERWVRTQGFDPKPALLLLAE